MTYQPVKTMQYESEILAFIDVLKKENVRSYLEIGSKCGGSLWRYGTSLSEGSRIVSVDLPGSDKTFGPTLPHLEQCVGALRARGYDTHLIIGDSTDPNIVERVRALGPFDLCLIDANHTEPYVVKDWVNYGPLCKIVAFHDINFSRLGGQPQFKIPIDVPKVWGRIKNGYRHVEIKHDKQDNGIGILWQ